MRSKFINLTLILSLITLAACNGGGGSASGVAGDTTGTTTSTTDSCTSGVIDGGSKGVAAATLRGVTSDTANNPTNSYPAVAYSDGGSLSVKFSYWNGTQWIHETIAGYPNTVNNLSLVFLTTGIPVVAWTSNGTDVLIATRAAATSTVSSSWTAKILTSAATNARTVRLATTPTNMVGGIYMSSAATTGRIRFILCSANCNNVNNYQVTGDIDSASATVANQVQVGFGWCGADTNADTVVDAYYPAATVTRTASLRYVSCQNATIANCAVAANWATNAQISATAVLSSTIHLDPSVANDVVKVAGLLPATGVKAYLAGTPGTPINCFNIASGSTFTQSTQTLGTANTGNLWIDYLKNSTRYHIVANESTTSVSYFNTNDVLSANWATHWNTTAHTMNTTTVSGEGGAHITSAGKIYSTHYSNAATNRFNAIINTIADTTVASSASTSVNQFVNMNGNLDFPGAIANVNKVSVAKTSTGEVGVAYADYSVATVAGGVLKYAYRDGSLTDSSWIVTTIPGVTAPSFPVLKYDHNNIPWIGYFDYVSFRWYLLTNSTEDGTGTWTSYVVPVYPTGVGTHPATPMIGLAMYVNAGVKQPVVAVIDQTNGLLRSSKFNPTTSSWSALVNIEALGANRASNLDMTNDESGNIVVAYLDRQTTFIDYAHSSNGATTWSRFDGVSSVASAGQGLTIAINSYNSLPVISYIDRANNRMVVTSCSNSLSGCATSGWSTSNVDLATGVSAAFTNAVTGNEVMLSTAIAMRTSGSYDILYTHGPGASGHLKRVKMDELNNQLSSSNFMLAPGTNMLSTSMHLGLPGVVLGATITSGNHLVTAYLGDGNVLKHRSCDLDVID